MADAETWFDAPSSVGRYVRDLVASELQALRPGANLPDRPWPAELRLDHGGLDCDSLEMMSLSAAVAEATHMHCSGVEDYLLARRTIGDWEQIVAASLQRFCEQLTFHTSGSTGAAVSCTHRLGDLVEEIREIAGLLPRRARLLCAVPSHHIYGFLFSVLLAAELELPVIDIRDRSPATLGRELRPGDLVIGHPVFWQAAARAIPTFVAGVIGVTSSAPCPDEVAEALSRQGLARLIEIYGSSETSGIGWRDTPGAPYRLFSYWHRENATTLTRAGVNGSECRHACPDRLTWTGARHLSVNGRHDGAVQVGGVNVFPAAVASRLRSHPAVAQAAVRLMLPHEGARLKAFVVPRNGDADTDQIAAQLSEWCIAHLTTAERPKAFTFGPALPSGPLAKPADWPLPLSV